MTSHERAHLFGHAAGGLVARRTAIRHPDRILPWRAGGSCWCAGMNWPPDLL
ncbi:MAG TPA: hypothetical protein VFO01_02340 [Trebonia sp.]|nr:hypothetical protein [Trebonia sp.]